MLTIRLSRQGAKKRPFYHIVATDSRKPRDSGYIEKLGFFNPHASGQQEILRIDKERLEYWLSQGGQMSDRIKHLYKSHINNKDLRAKLDAHRQRAADRVEKMRDDAEKALAEKLAAKEQGDEAPADEDKAAGADAETSTDDTAASAKDAEDKGAEDKTGEPAEAPKEEAKADKPVADEPAEVAKEDDKTDEPAEAAKEKAKAADSATDADAAEPTESAETDDAKKDEQKDPS